MAYHRYHGWRTRIVRIFNTFGTAHASQRRARRTGVPGQVIRKEPFTVFGDGSQTRSFCYVEDTVDGIVRLLHSDSSDPVNVGNPNEFTILEFGQAVERLAEHAEGIRFQPLPEDDPKVRQPDISRAKALLGWEPPVVPAGWPRPDPRLLPGVLGR